MRGALQGILILLVCAVGAVLLVVHKQHEKEERTLAAQRVAAPAERVVSRSTPPPAPTANATSRPPATEPPPAIAPPLSPQPSVAALPGEAQRKPVQPYWYEGASGWDAARTEQREANAPLLIYFHTTWCGWCKKLDREIYPALGVDRILRDIVKVKLNPEASDAERTLAMRFGVHGYPSVFVLANPSARPIKLAPFAGTPTSLAEEFALQLERAGATALP
jgi:thiol:disulfide interchange protein